MNNSADNPNHRSPWNVSLWIVPVALWLALTANGAEKIVAAPTPMATPVVLADVMAPRIYFNSTPKVFVTAHFQLVNSRDAQWSATMGAALEMLYEAYTNDMKALGFSVNEPSEPLIWVCFENEKPFVEYARQADSFNANWLREYYSPRTNRVAIISEPAAQTVGMESSDEPHDIMAVSHEAAHQFSYSTGLFKRGVMYPAWVTEGAAMCFETSSMRQLGLNKFNTARMKQLIKMRREGRMVPVGQMTTMTHFRPDEGHDVGDLYAQADGFFHFLLISRGEQLRGYIAKMTAMKQGRRSAGELTAEFAAAFGAVKALESEWSDYLDGVERTLMGSDNISPATPSSGIAGLVTPVVNR